MLASAAIEEGKPGVANCRIAAWDSYKGEDKAWKGHTGTWLESAHHK